MRESRKGHLHVHWPPRGEADRVQGYQESRNTRELRLSREGRDVLAPDEAISTITYLSYVRT